MSVEFAIALSAVLFTLVTLGATFTGIGLTVRRAFTSRALAWDDVSVSLWVGYGVALLFLILWNFVLPIGLPALIGVVTTGGLGLAITRHQWLALFAGDSWKPRWWEWPLLLMAAFWVTDQCLAAFASWDDVLYHVQAVKWAKAYPVVPGIANLHGPLAFNNSSFLYDAMVDSGWWEGRGFHVANGVLLLAAVMHAVIGILRWLRGGGLATGRACFSLLMLALAFHLMRDVASYSTDVPLTLALVEAAALTYALLDLPAGESRAADETYGVFALGVILAAAVTIKLTAGTFAAVALPVTIVILRRKHQWNRARFNRVLIGISLAIVVFAGAWIARGIVMSGYPFFPIGVAGAPLDWRAPLEHARAEAAYIAMTEREFTWKLIGSNWIRLIFVRDINAVLVPATVASLALLAGWRWRRRAQSLRAGPDTWWLALPLLLAIGIWLVTAPSHRYAPALFWSLAALCVAEGERARQFAFGGRGRAWAGAALATIAISPIFVDSARIVAPASDSALSTLPGGVRVTGFRTRSGLELNIPTRAVAGGPLPNACGDVSLPCTPNPAPNLKLRVPGSLAHGFRVDGDWEMQDWPYYWQSFFLPEWRRRHAPGPAGAK